MAVAFFDLDKTLCSVPTEQLLSKYLFKHGLIKKSHLFSVIWGFILYNFHLIDDYTTFRKNMVRSIMKGMSVKDFRKTLNHVYDQEFRHLFLPEVLERISMHKANNHRIVIVSTALNEIVQVFADNIHADYHYSTELVIEDSLYTGDVIGNVYYGKYKQQAVQDYCSLHNIDPTHCYAYGDYFEDRLMMEAVGNPVAINPDKKLLEHAKKRNWKIITSIRKKTLTA